MGTLSSRAWGVTAAMCVAAGAAAHAQGVMHVPAGKVASIQEKGGAVAVSANAIVSMNRRTGAGQSEVHDKETDTFYVLEGSATFVTGGTVVGGKTTAPGQIRGTGIDGGQTMQLRKGDVVVVPAGIPHWFKEVPTLVVYYTVKALKP